MTSLSAGERVADRYIYAACDVPEGLDQISVATGQGAIAATRIHNWLREQDGHAIADQQ